MFAVTNIDHMLVLSVFFGQAGAHQGRAWRVVAGQYLGFSASWPRPCSGWTTSTASAHMFSLIGDHRTAA